MNKYLSNLISGICGGLLVLAVAYFYGQNFFIDANISDGLDYFKKNFKNISMLNQETEIDAGRWQKLVSQTSISLVGVQSFRDGKIWKQGSGLILSSDGLIVTTYDMVSSGASLSQVFYGDKIYTPVVLVRDYAKNLLLLKIDAENLTVSRLDQLNQIQVGEELLVVGNAPFLSKPTIFSQTAMLGYVTENEVAINTVMNPYIGGAKVVNSRNEVLGMIQTRSNKVTLIRSQDIDSMLKNYLNKANQ